MIYKIYMKCLNQDFNQISKIDRIFLILIIMQISY